MRLRVVGCIVVTVLIVGMYMIIAYGDELGIVHPINRTIVSPAIDQNLTNDSTSVLQYYFDNSPNHIRVERMI